MYVHKTTLISKWVLNGIHYKKLIACDLIHTYLLGNKEVYSFDMTS